MTTTLSSKGQIVLNANLRRAPGMKFEIRGESDRIVLEPLRPQKPKARIIQENSTKCSVLDVEEAPTLTSDRVAAALNDFP
jgi:bifunctional DNA-binding transcriptional regulator/antitoxin component of YhaV-PrlF toxin-antitoxin module